MYSLFRNKGVTLIELMVVVAIITIIATISAPSLSQFFLKSRLRGAADLIFSDLIYARSEAVSRNRTIFVSISAGTNWCYGLNAGNSCNCNIANSCNVKTVSSSAFQGISLVSSFTSLSFDATQGTVSGAGGTIGTDTILFQNTLGQAGVKLLPISVRICAPSSYANVMGYPPC